jgi:hypothetical protein
LTGLDRTLGLHMVEVFTVSRQSANEGCEIGCPTYRPLYPPPPLDRRYPMVLISVKGSVNPRAIVRPDGLKVKGHPITGHEGPTGGVEV